MCRSGNAKERLHRQNVLPGRLDLTIVNRDLELLTRLIEVVQFVRDNRVRNPIERL